MRWAPLLLVCLAAGVVATATKEIYYPDYKMYHDHAGYEEAVSAFAADAKLTKYLSLTRYHSYRGNNINVFKLTDSSRALATNGNRKLRIMFSFGEHAREFIPVESFLNLVRNLTAGIQHRCFTREYRYAAYILENAEIYLIGMLNPDGRKKLEESKDYCWRGTDHDGIDINRNCDWEFGGEGSSNKPGSEEYHGDRAFSEPESRLVRDLARNISLDAFFSMHAGIRHIYVPFADSKSKKMQRHFYNENNALRLAKSIAQDAGEPSFQYGVANVLNDYPADGTLFDYMGGVEHVPYSFAIEMWGSGGDKPTCFDIFNPESDKLQDEVRKLERIYTTIFRALIAEVVGVDLLDGGVAAASLTYLTAEKAALLQQTCLMRRDIGNTRDRLMELAKTLREQDSR